MGVGRDRRTEEVVREILARINGRTEREVPTEPATVDKDTEATSAEDVAAVPDVLAEATVIVQKAQQVAKLDEIDWTDEPKDEREAKLRAAILRRIECEWGSSSPLGATWLWTRKLRALAPDDAEFLAGDLYDEIERVERVVEDAAAESERNERAELMEAALREVEQE